jgi:branched-subunit amino acid aminotransferase/4-amino-4-deoxychorismate lyase
MMTSVWMNRGVSINPAALGDRGFSTGLRVMTTLKIISGIAIDLGRHYERLIEHGELSGLIQGDGLFKIQHIEFDIQAALAELTAQGVDCFKSHIICRIFITAGAGEFFASPVARGERWVQLEVIPAATDASPLKIDCRIDGGRRRGAHIKTGLYLDCWSALQKARLQGFDDVLWCNGDQEICELSTSNIFLIGREGDLVEIATPPASCGILMGVTRRRISELLLASKIPVTERIIQKDEIPRFDEAFTASSIRGLRPIERIGTHRLHTMRPNAVFHHISRLWNSWIENVATVSDS